MPDPSIQHYTNSLINCAKAYTLLRDSKGKLEEDIKARGEHNCWCKPNKFYSLPTTLWPIEDTCENCQVALDSRMRLKEITERIDVILNRINSITHSLINSEKEETNEQS